MGGILIANFIINIVEKEIDPDSVQPYWETIDVIFNAIFLVELLANMYGYGGPTKEFWSSPWNCFDFVIVAVGVVLMSGVDLGNWKKLKLARAFRVFRLFKRIESLNKIITALARAIPGMINAFIIILIFFCIYPH